MSSLAVSIKPLDGQRRESGLTETFVVRGELDIASSRVLERVLIDELAAIPDQIVLQLGELAFIDVAGLRALERVRAYLAAHGCRLALRSVPSQAARLLQLAAGTGAAKPADRAAHRAARRRAQSPPMPILANERRAGDEEGLEDVRTRALLLTLTS